jgi:hypothetical protein
VKKGTVVRKTHACSSFKLPHASQIRGETS